MKKYFSAAALAVTAAFLLPGCVTEVRVDNPSDPRGEWVHLVSGDLVVRYPGKTQEELFHAANKALDEYLCGPADGRKRTGRRTGENYPKDNPSLPPAYETFARTEGDVLITIRITTESSSEPRKVEAEGEPAAAVAADKAPAKEEVKEWTQISISYGSYGNLPESQKIVSFIAKHLR